MSEAKHTPGPWRVDPEQDIDIQSADGATEIAVALSRSLDGVRFTFAGKMPSKKATLANARLIAAAPALFEYVASSASAGCVTATALIAAITTSQRAEK